MSGNSPRAVLNALEGDETQERQRRHKVSKLDTFGLLAAEGRKVYRAARQGDMDTRAALRLLQSLRLIGDLMKDDGILERLEAVEEQLAQGKPALRRQLNGASHASV